MLEGPVARTVLTLAWPNILMMIAQSSTGLIESWFVARLGTDTLAGTALVLPLLMLMQNMSQGAMGGGISSAIARALGADRKAEADRYVLHALVLNIVLGVVFSVAELAAARWLYPLLGGKGASLHAALAYSNVIFCGITLMWVMNAFASAIRGTGNMLVPGLVICGGAFFLIPLSPCLIFGIGPFPKLGIAGAGYALLLYYGVGAAILGQYCLSGRNPARLRRGRLAWPMFRNILVVGGMATINSLQTNVMIALSTALVGAYAGTAAVAGYGTGARLEYFIAPLAFGIGAPLVAMVGSNIGAKQPERALRVAMVGGGLAFALAETIGLVVAIWPHAWLGLFSHDPKMLAAGTVYLRSVGPFYGFFGMGWSLYFASQGAGRLKWPLLSGFFRLLLTVGGGWIALRLTGSLVAFFAVAGAAMFLYGVVIVIATLSGTWFRNTPAPMRHIGTSSISVASER
ncbi:MATE family efflux transporter [Trinickia acidisoli]|uniref:MATE family efflux transporter n=1 Tax=Trinickia acidisoli TaxID=2767482 RepID=UPI001A8F939C|nr:MATE family efflux transporter [Trinickia acidisoli]